MISSAALNCLGAKVSHLSTFLLSFILLFFFVSICFVTELLVPGFYALSFSDCLSLYRYNAQICTMEGLSLLASV